MVSEHGKSQPDKPRQTWSGPASTADGLPREPSAGVLRAVAIALISQGAFRLLFLAYTIITVASLVSSGTFWSDNPKFVASSVASFMLGVAAIVVGAGILRAQPWARAVGITVCAIALLGEAYVAFNLASNFAQLGMLSTVMYSGLTAIYTAVFVVSLAVLSRWRPKPPGSGS